MPVNNIISKSSKRIYLLVQLKSAKVPDKEIVNFYNLCPPYFGVSSAVIHYYSLPKYFSDEIKHYAQEGMRRV